MSLMKNSMNHDGFGITRATEIIAPVFRRDLCICCQNALQLILQPRSQAFPSCGGKTLVQAGHVTPRFLEITKIRVGGGEWYNMLIRRTVNTNKAVLYVCVDRIV